MAKAKKVPTRKPAPRSPPRAPAPLVNSLPPQILEEAAQGWLKSSGAPAAVPPPSKNQDRKAEALVDCLDATLQNLRAELSDLKDRVARLESRRP